MTDSRSFRAAGAGVLSLLLKGAAALLAGLAATHALADDPGALRQKYGELREQLRDNPFHRPLYIDSAQSDASLQGDVYAVLDQPMSKVSQGMKEPTRWCDILILPFNTKYCRAGEGADAARLQLRIGRKPTQPAEQAYKLDFSYRNVAASNDYFESRLNAPSGPLGTRDYRITVSAIPVEGGKTFMHLSYAYAVGGTGKLAMQMYLSTAGANKVGFSRVPDASGQPRPVGGVRGAIERNAMRYYLAIDAFLNALDASPAQQVDRRIQAWIDSADRYPQLHEMDRASYIAMKRQDYERQQTASLQ